MKYKRKLIILFCLLMLLLIIDIVFFKDINKIDNIIIHRNVYFTSFFKIITRFGDSYTLIGLTLLTLLLKKRKYFKYISINLVLVAIINFILKIITQRGRPTIRLIDVSGYSFPSGHAMVSLAFYGFIIYLVNKTINNKKVRVVTTIVLSLLILLIGFSRIYLGVHYITDVLAGFIFSIIYLCIFTKIYKKL